MKLGSLYHIKFWDHAMNREPLECEVFGKVTELTVEHVKVVAWDLSTKDEPFRIENQESFSIMKRLITGFGELRLKKWTRCY